MTVVLGLGSALLIGLADVFGTLAVRRGRLWASVMWIFASSGVTMVGISIVVGGSPSIGDLGLGAIAGFASALALLALYRGYEISELGIVGPTAGVTGAIVPVAVGFAIDGAPASLTLTGMVLGVIAVGLIGWSPPAGGSLPSHRTAGIAFGIAAGACFGVMGLGLGLVDEDSGLWPAVLTRFVSFATIVVIATTLGRPRSAEVGTARNIVLGGSLSALGVLLFVLTAQRDLAVAGLLVQLSFGVTVLAAVLLLGERSLPTQKIGFLAAAVSVVFITLG